VESADNFEQVDAMKLEEIAFQIEVKYRDWGYEHLATLDEVASNPEIAALISKLMEEASKHKLSITGKPIDAVRNCMKLTATACFRVGLMIGLMLDRTNDNKSAYCGEVVKPCERCETTGQECSECGKSKFNCTCGLGKFSPVACLSCNGEGYVA
jgi:hypothetical protein